jgi:tRNA threonylcarbamoyladenosine biosynthesis protein TsaB
VNILAIDISTDLCSVAYAPSSGTSVPGDILQRAETGQRPSRHVLQLADELLAEAGATLSSVDALAFGRGPGMFTGLRIAAGVVQGWALGLDRPVLGISSLQALAQRAHEQHGAAHVAAMLDARMNEVYVGHFKVNDAGLVQAQGEEQLCPPDTYQLPDAQVRPDFLAGPGWSAYPQLEQFVAMLPFDDTLRPEAAMVARLALPRFIAGEGGAPETAIPVYLRDTVAWQKSS